MFNKIPCRAEAYFGVGELQEIAIRPQCEAADSGNAMVHEPLVASGLIPDLGRPYDAIHSAKNLFCEIIRSLSEETLACKRIMEVGNVNWPPGDSGRCRGGCVSRPTSRRLSNERLGMNCCAV